VRKLGSLCKKNILRYQEFETFQQMSRMILISFGLQRVLTDHVQRPQFASLHRLEHLRQMPTLLRRDFHPPMPFELFAERDVLNMLEPGQTIRQCAHVAAALNIVLASKRIQPAAIPAYVSSQ